MEQKIKNASIQVQLLTVFMTIGVAMFSITALGLSLNYKTMEKHGEYLEYISRISELTEISNEGKVIIDDLFYNANQKEAERLIALNQEAGNLIENIKCHTNSVEIGLRLRVVAYLFQQYEKKANELSSIIEMHNEYLKEDSPAYTLHLEGIEILGRIDTYIQEIISCSVQENQEFLKRTSKNSSLVQYIAIVLAIFVFTSVMYLGVRYSQYLEQLMIEIVELTKSISKGNKIEKLEVSEGPEEIRDIITSFNKLIMTMEMLNKKADEKVQLELKLAEEQLEKSRMREMLKTAQLQGMQFQIKPHFLFNTLNVISMQAIMDDNRKIYDLIMSLSRFMRYSLKTTTTLVPLEEEVDMVKQYLYILKARKGNELNYEIINEVKEEIEIPPFTVQPLVENAFRHGIEDKVGESKIIVHLSKRRGNLILRIFNDGKPMTKEELCKVRLKSQIQTISMEEEQHIGIGNVFCRLNMLFPKQVKYQIYSSASRGTLFTIQISSLKREKV